MPGTMEYIESYFQNTLSEEEKTAFEKRCETDESFAKEVAFYITARQVLREELLAQKQQQWKEIVAEETTVAEEETPVISMTKKSTLLRWITYAAAACLLIIASVFLFEAQTSTQRLASNYIKDINLETTMDASHDSLQLGVAAYKNGDFTKALAYFEGVADRDPSNSDAKKYTGVAYLQLNNYDKALQEFDELSKMEGLRYNPGDFLKAVTLLKRDGNADEESAKVLLEKVVKENESESEKAKEWLKKF